MKTLVTYYSLTGNTEKVAKAIYEAVDGKKDLLKISDVTNIDHYDLIFIGFPVYNFEPAKEAKNFILKYTTGKNIVLFITMSLTAAPQNEQTRFLYNLTIENCKSCTADASLKGIFDCPGELSEETAQALINSQNPELRQFGEMRVYTLGYPTEKNLADAGIMTKSFVGSCSFSGS